uniref:Myb/SANT-like DNA-binding domain-containing protein n=1 Tax=Haplochromis burtoni TaxID=8153 RepID=A0A3Q2WUK6_HAPBU
MDGEMEIKRERSTGMPTKKRICHLWSSAAYVSFSFHICSFIPDAHRAHTDFCSDQVVTVSDAGRNWSDQEVQALIQVWSDERICRKLESSTRKRDIFVQISRRLLQQGIDRDWKQCHTKYRNLKYLYRSLQRGKTDEADPRCLMRFYEEVDSIMNRVTNDYTEEDSDRLTISDNCDEKNNVDGNLANTRRAAEDKTCTSDSDLTIEASNTCASESEVDKENTTASNRRLKRKAVDEGLKCVSF